VLIDWTGTINQDRDAPIEGHRVKYRNNVAGLDQQFVKRLTRPIINSRF
jgi:transposase-like protein